MKLFLFISLISLNAFAIQIEPLRYNPHSITNPDFRGFVQGQIDDVFYHQVLDCALVELQTGMIHRLAVTFSRGQGKFYEYIDLDSEGMYKILSQGKVQVTETDSSVVVQDAQGGSINFSGKIKKQGQATVALKDPALLVDEAVTCWREK
jgi:hypothetical protein